VAAIGAAFEILPAAGTARGVVGHVPHAGTRIPPEVRAGLLLHDAALAHELVQLTDWHTDELFGWLPDLGAATFVNRVSRLVVDPERFEQDAAEPAAGFGQGVVYSRTCDGAPLRAPDAAARERLLATYYRPYHAALTALVGEVLAAHGRCLIVDGHSFASVPLPSELDQAPDRPDICIGTDEVHTPEPLADALEAGFRAAGLRVRRDSPFAGALVPLRYLGRDPRVTTVMLEVRRGLYCDEATGARSAGFGEVAATLRRVVAEVLPG
jgi:N-formylglutamate deformylase